MKLAGKVALVTGGARGLGRAYALRLAKLGADVVVNDINLDSARAVGEELTAPSVVAEIEGLQRRALAIEADVTDKKQVDAMVETILDHFGRLDIAVCNAGGLKGHPDHSYAVSVSPADLHETVQLNLIGTIYTCQAAAVPMMRQRWGRIVTIGSQAGLRAFEGGFYASYAAAKAAVIHYTRTLAQQLAPYGINVNCIAPAYIETRRLARNLYDVGERRQRIVSSIPMGRIGTTEDCAGVLEFLVTDLSDYVTGQCISVCGGVINF